jgi:methylaspartate ammonia-lyase
VHVISGAFCLNDNIPNVYNSAPHHPRKKSGAMPAHPTCPEQCRKTTSNARSAMDGPAKADDDACSASSTSRANSGAARFVQSRTPQVGMVTEALAAMALCAGALFTNPD